MANATATTIRLSEIGIPAKIRAKAAGNIHAATGMLSMCVIRGLFRRSAEDPAQDLEPQGRQADRHRQLERPDHRLPGRSEEHTSELQSLMRISYAVFSLTK